MLSLIKSGRKLRRTFESSRPVVDIAFSLAMLLAGSILALYAMVRWIRMLTTGINRVSHTLGKILASSSDIQCCGGPNDGEWHPVNKIERLWFRASTAKESYHTYILARKLKSAGPLQWRYFGVVSDSTKRDEEEPS